MRVAARGTTIKASGAAAAAVFDALTTRVDKRLAPGAQVAYTIHFEDHGQDFLEWDIGADGQVLDSRPCQAWVWAGQCVTARPEPGALVRLMHGQQLHGHQQKVVTYPVAKVVTRITRNTPTTRATAPLVAPEDC